MILHRRWLLLATALAAVACIRGPAGDPAGRRLELLHDAVRLQRSNPMRAAALARTAGPGAGLERFRLKLWLDCLRRAGAPAGAWREAAAQAPRGTLARRALLGLGRALLAEGESAAGVAVLRRAAGFGSREADLELLTVPDPAAQEEAARRLAVLDPGRLRRADSAAERAVLGKLSHAELLERAEMWRRRGAPRTAARELVRHRWRGADEAARRRELARCRLAAGEPRRALRALPSAKRSGAPELLLRAQARRARGWALYPRRPAKREFALALTAAQAAGRRSAGDPETTRTALEIVLEAATEVRRLDEAWRAWRELGALGWTGGRRSWLGRRLGLAMIRKGGLESRVRELANELPDQARCLGYWRARRAGSASALQALTKDPFPDLYAVWAASDLSVALPTVVTLRPPAGPGDPPSTVRLLLDWGETAAARREWRRLRRERGATPREALAAVPLEASGARPTEAIRWLRSGFPCLRGRRLDLCPSDAAQAYLPLRWADAVRRAALEAGIEPWLLAGLARQESSFVAHARSPRGAVGVAQLVPGTARRHARALGLGRRPDLTDPAVNLRLGARELARLLARLGALEPALAAYNAGETRTRRWSRRWPDPRRFTEEIPIPETYTYVRRIVFLAQAYRLMYADEWRQGR